VQFAVPRGCSLLPTRAVPLESIGSSASTATRRHDSLQLEGSGSTNHGRTCTDADARNSSSSGEDRNAGFKAHDMGNPRHFAQRRASTPGVVRESSSRKRRCRARPERIVGEKRAAAIGAKCLEAGRCQPRRRSPLRSFLRFSYDLTSCSAKRTAVSASRPNNARACPGALRKTRALTYRGPIRVRTRGLSRHREEDADTSVAQKWPTRATRSDTPRKLGSNRTGAYSSTRRSPTTLQSSPPCRGQGHLPRLKGSSTIWS